MTEWIRDANKPQLKSMYQMIIGFQFLQGI